MTRGRGTVWPAAGDLGGKGAREEERTWGWGETQASGEQAIAWEETAGWARVGVGS